MRNMIGILIQPLIRVAGLAAITSVLVLGVIAPAHAADEVNVSKGLTAEGAPLALHGYDPVAFFTEAIPTAGSDEYAVVHEGATYYFASRAHRKAFRANPGQYVPAFGGFCAYGVSVGKKFDGDPRYWTIWNDRLYLNLNAKIAEKFMADVQGAVAKADTNWREIRNRSVGDL